MKSKQSVIIIILIFSTVLLFYVIKQMTKDEMKKSEFESMSNLYGVIMIPKDSSITTSGLSLLFKNESDVSYYYSSAYTLEKFIDNQWCKIPYETDFNNTWTTEAYDLAPNSSSIWVVDWRWLYGLQDEGHYRIIKQINVEGNVKDVYLLSAEFDINY